MGPAHKARQVRAPADTRGRGGQVRGQTQRWGSGGVPGKRRPSEGWSPGRDAAVLTDARVPGMGGFTSEGWAPRDGLRRWSHPVPSYLRSHPGLGGVVPGGVWKEEPAGGGGGGRWAAQCPSVHRPVLWCAVRAGAARNLLLLPGSGRCQLCCDWTRGRFRSREERRRKATVRGAGRR